MFSSYKYLLIGIISSLLLLFIMWFAILVQQHPDDWQYYHLDLYTTFEDFVRYFDTVHFTSLGGFDVSENGSSILSSVSSWFSNTMSQGFNYVNTAIDRMSEIFNKNAWISFMMTLTGITQIFYAIMLISKVLLVGGFLITFIINIIDMLVCFLVAFLSAISHPYFIYIAPPTELSSLCFI